MKYFIISIIVIAFSSFVAYATISTLPTKAAVAATSTDTTANDGVAEDIEVPIESDMIGSENPKTDDTLSQPKDIKATIKPIVTATPTPVIVTVPKPVTVTPTVVTHDNYQKNEDSEERDD